MCLENDTAARTLSGRPATSRAFWHARPNAFWTNGWARSTWRWHRPVKYCPIGRPTFEASRCSTSLF